MENESATRARVAGRMAKAATIRWSLEVGGVKLRCVPDGERFIVEMRPPGPTEAWQRMEKAVGYDPHVLLVAVVQMASVKTLARAGLTHQKIPVEKENPVEPPFEHCCFCCKPTAFWTKLPDRKPGEQVACCESCAGVNTPDDVPTKKTWCDAESKKHPRST